MCPWCGCALDFVSGRGRMTVLREAVQPCGGHHGCGQLRGQPEHGNSDEPIALSDSRAGPTARTHAAIATTVDSAKRPVDRHTP